VQDQRQVFAHFEGNKLPAIKYSYSYYARIKCL